jgi:hypothetical protein
MPTQDPEVEVSDAEKAPQVHHPVATTAAAVSDKLPNPAGDGDVVQPSSDSEMDTVEACMAMFSTDATFEASLRALHSLRSIKIALSSLPGRAVADRRRGGCF